ncbi:bacterial extracellular solute-binding protein, family 7 domain-containing protein [Ditylenchus destructor]|uniref:Bacterial extracellular solute-binding protein, family 7 domain-containing protein n=1 Tax=Ditylenchus destructor TaxID=166010 RepID=A0AAD4MG20_9BILA|nr:bacterial extracellular solute-binding protein, family 7 domain-containing protein [Ditylenchus destructor]
MKFRRTLLGLAAVATALGMFSSGAMAQAAYKPEYKMSLVLGPPTPAASTSSCTGRVAHPGRPDARVQRAAPGRDRHGRGLDHQLVAAGQAAQPVLHALPDARLRGHRRAHAGRGRQGDVQDARQGRRGAARVGRERLPRDHQLEEADQVAGRHQGHEDPRGGLAHLLRHVHRAGRQPHADELGRRAARAGQRRGRRPGEPALPVHGAQDADGGPEVRDHLGLRGRPLVFVVNKEIWASWTPADQAIVRQAAIDAGKEEIAIARKGLVEADKPVLKDIAGMGVTVTSLTPAERAEFVKATRPVYDKWKSTIGADLVAKAEQAIAARKK